MLSYEEQMALLDNYRNSNDNESHDKLIKHNLRPCLFAAQKYLKFVRNLSLMDLFDENVITLMKAID